eukprot:COSAG02_NODE_2929_length_7719_cov_2.442242_7_plen_39_part_00
MSNQAPSAQVDLPDIYEFQSSYEYMYQTVWKMESGNLP